MKAGELEAALMSVRSLVTRKIPFKAKFRLSTMEKKLLSAFQLVHGQKQELLTGLGATVVKKDGAPDSLVPPDGKQVEAAQGLKKIDDTELDVEVPTIRLSLFGDFTDDGNEIAFIHALIEDDTEKP